MTPLARLLGMKVVMTHHGPDYERKKWGMLAKIILRTGETWGCKWANKVIAIADNIADDIKRKYDVTAAVIPNGVVVPIPAQSEEILKKYDLKPHGYVLAVGRFVPEKGFHDLIDAYKFICLRNAFNWKLVIAGGADHPDNYSRALKEKAAATPGVVLTGFITGNPLKELYSHAGLFVLPSYYEGLPIVLLEALSYGLSCVVSDIPANRNVSLPDARFFDPGNIPVLAKKINDFCLRPLTVEERAAQLQMIQNEYNWPSIADATRNVYKTII
jgi:glycosyltransferase involved in cell wall biosynthesis